MATSTPPIQEVLDSGAVADLVPLLKPEHEPRWRFQAAWILTNIASGTSEQTAALLAYGVLPHFVQGLQIPEDRELVDQCLWALGNISGDSAQFRDEVIHAPGFIDSMLHLCEPAYAHFNLHRQLAWLMSNCCRGDPPPTHKPDPAWAAFGSTIQEGLTSTPLPTSLGSLVLAYAQPDHPIMRFCAPLKRLLHSEDTEARGDALWALSYLCSMKEAVRFFEEEALLADMWIKSTKARNNGCFIYILRNLYFLLLNSGLLFTACSQLLVADSTKNARDHFSCVLMRVLETYESFVAALSNQPLFELLATHAQLPEPALVARYFAPESVRFETQQQTQKHPEVTKDSIIHAVQCYIHRMVQEGDRIGISRMRTFLNPQRREFFAVVLMQAAAAN